MGECIYEFMNEGIKRWVSGWVEDKYMGRQVGDGGYFDGLMNVSKRMYG